MKPFLSRSLLSILLFLLSYPLYAGEGKANMALVSDYILRGASASNNNSALQLGYEYDYNSAWSVGSWLSTVPSGYEYDLYARYGHEFGSWAYSTGVIYYGYTGAASAPAELNLAVSYYGLSLMASRGEGVTYDELHYEISFFDTALRLHYGSNGTDPDYAVYLMKEFGGIDVGVILATKIDSVSTLATDVYALSISKSF